MRIKKARVPWWSFTKTALATAALQLSRTRLFPSRRADHDSFPLRCANCSSTVHAGVPDYGGLAAYHDAVRRGEKLWATGELLDWRWQPTVSILFRGRAGVIPMSDICLFASSSRQPSVAISAAPCGISFSMVLNLRLVRMATSAEDLADTPWGNSTGYDPGWVYHGLLVGTSGDAVRFLHRLMSGGVLPRESADRK